MADRYHLLIAPDSTTSPRAPGPGRRVVSVPGVCGGDACLEGTRVPVWVLERARRWNKPLAEFLEDYPFLSEADLRSAWDYAGQNVEAIDRQIRENEDA